MDSERVGFKITQLALINWSIGYKRVMFDCGVLHFGFVFFLRFNKDRKKSLQCIQNLYYRYSDSQTHYRNQVAIVHKSTFSPSVGHKPTWGVRLIRLWNWPLLHPFRWFAKNNLGVGERKQCTWNIFKNIFDIFNLHHRR